MRRKSERNKGKPAEKKPEPSPKKSRRSSRRRKRSTSRSSSEDSDDAPLKIAPEVVEPEVPPPEEPKKPSSHSNSEEDKDEQPIWKVKTSDAASGEIQKIKICLQRPSTTPERTEKSPRRRRGKTSSQSDEASLTPDEKMHKRKTRNNSPSLNTSDGSSLDNSAIEAAEKDENLIIIKETNEIIIGKGKLDSSQTQQDSENEKYVQDSQIEENEKKESHVEFVKKDDTVELKNDQDVSHVEEKQIHEESSNKKEDEKMINNKETKVPQIEEKVDEINALKEKDSKDIESDSDKSKEKEKPEDDSNKTIKDQPEDNSDKIKEQPEDNSDKIKEQPEDNSDKIKEQPEDNSDKIKKEVKPDDDSIKNKSQTLIEEDKKDDTNKCYEMDSTVLNYSAVSEEANTSTEVKDTTVEEESNISNVADKNEKTESPENNETSVEKMETPDSVIAIPEKSASPNEEENPVNKREKSPEVQDKVTETPEDSDKKLDESSTKSSESNEKLESTNEKVKLSEKSEPAKIEETTEASGQNLKELNKVQESPETEETSEVSEQNLEVSNKVQESPETLESSCEKTQKPVEEKLDAIKKSKETSECEKSNHVELKMDTTESTKKMSITDTIQIEEDSTERIIRKRKWGKYKVNLNKEERITSSSIASFCPLIKMLNVEELKLEKQDAKEYEPKLPKRDRNKDKDTVQIPFAPKNEDETEKEVSNIGLNRKISIVNDEASKLQPPPSPATNPVSAILYITNLVRPFTLKQLQELLSRTGKIVEDGFWTDKIKSKCYVEYETEEEAENTRNALHGVQWPTGNGKKLVIDFATTESMKAARNVNIEIPVVVKTAADEIPEKVAENAKKETDSNEQRWDAQRTTTAPIREWDLGKVPQDLRDRSRSKDRMDNRSERAEKRRPNRSDSPSNGDQLTSRKKRKDEQTEVKLMDDLFHKTKATPSIYWLPLSPDQIAKKQQQRLQRMAEHKRRMEESRRFDRDRDFGRGGGQRARRRSARYDGD